MRTRAAIVAAAACPGWNNVIQPLTRLRRSVRRGQRARHPRRLPRLDLIRAAAGPPLDFTVAEDIHKVAAALLGTSR